MNEYNLIPLGDHCAVSEILKELGLRKCSYPFDWITNVNYLYQTNLITNFILVSELMEKHNVKEIVQKLIGNALQTEKKVYNKNAFLHDHGEECDIIAKYERRFERLYNDIRDKKNIFIMLTRHKTLLETDFTSILSTILSYNKNNKILFISGSDHPYLYDPKYSGSVIFKFIFYNLKNLDDDFNYDYTYFRPTICNYMHDLFGEMGYNLSSRIKADLHYEPINYHMSNIQFITFAGGNKDIIEAGKRLIHQAAKTELFEGSALFTDGYLMDDPVFWNKHGNFIKENSRGYGYYVWKPYIINITIDNLNDGDILVYLDAGCEIDHEKKDKIRSYFELVKTEKLIVSSSNQIEKDWSKMDLLHTLDMNKDEYLDTEQYQSGLFMIYICDETRKFMKEWYELCCNYHFIDDTPSAIPNIDGFVEHRHDQSVFSLLFKKYNFKFNYTMANIVEIVRNLTGTPILPTKKYLSEKNKILEIGGDNLKTAFVLTQYKTNYLVKLEHDPELAKQMLHIKTSNNIRCHIENSILTQRQLIHKNFYMYQNVNIITMKELSKKYDIVFDTLLLNCEDDFYYILQDVPEILNNITLIIMENRYNNISYKNYIDMVLKKNNFYVDYVLCGGPSSGCCFDNFYEVWVLQAPIKYEL